MSRFEAIAKALGIAAEDAAKMSPEMLRAKLEQPAAAAMKESKALGNTVHVVPSATEKDMAMKLMDNKPQFGKTMMRGVAAAPSMGLGSALSDIKEQVAEPLSQGWEDLKSKVYGPLSQQMNLTKDPEQAKNIEAALSMIADPTNLIGGGAGAGIAGLQMLGSKGKK